MHFGIHTVVHLAHLAGLAVKGARHLVEEREERRQERRQVAASFVATATETAKPAEPTKPSQSPAAVLERTEQERFTNAKTGEARTTTVVVDNGSASSVEQRRCSGSIGMGAWGYIRALVCFGVGIVYPLYASLIAKDTSGHEDDAKWLLYWITFALVTVVETVLPVLKWIPFYGEVKTALLLFLALPHTGGTERAHRDVIEPALRTAGPYADQMYKDYGVPALAAVMPTLQKYWAEYGGPAMQTIQQRLRHSEL